MIRKFGILLGTFALAGCGGDPDEAAYVAACKAAANMEPAMCQCTASEAKARFSPEAWKVFVLQAQGKAEEASKIALNMSAQAQGEMITATLAIVQKCGGEAYPK
jgi:hypothetical protein